jgi:hypothetical protein
MKEWGWVIMQLRLSFFGWRQIKAIVRASASLEPFSNRKDLRQAKQKAQENALSLLPQYRQPNGECAEMRTFFSF